MRILKVTGGTLLPLISLLFLASCSKTEQTTTAQNSLPEAVQAINSPLPDATKQTTNSRPNVLLVVADDLGFTDIGAFGSEIPTPNLDALAYEGVRLTSLHAAPACQQTRSMLIGSVPNSRGIISRPPLEGGERNNLLSLEWATLPELLQEAGYATYMAGKWDLGWDEGYTPATRGFDRSFVQLNGASSFFAEPLLLQNTTGFEEDGKPLEYSDLPEDFYVTDTYTEKMLEYLNTSPKDQPWFAYLPYTAPHWPLQLPDNWLDKHAGNYDEGYDQLRVARVESAKKQGVIQENLSLDGFVSQATPWNELSEQEQKHYSRAQEIYAGMIEHLDMSVGRIIEHLKETGQLENTLIIFSSDHGASSAEFGAATNLYGRRGVQPPEWIDNSLENFGRMNSFIDHGLGFAEAATAPFTNSKGSLYEGGLRAAAFVHYPQYVKGGTVSHTFMTMMDLLPTIMDAVGSEHPSSGTFKGREINDIRGVSAWPYLTGQTDLVHQNSVAGWATRGAALIKGDYKILKAANPGQQADTQWKLFNIALDPGERENIANAHPELVEEMADEWDVNWK